MISCWPAISKSNKQETFIKKKLINPLTNEKHILMSCNFVTYVSSLSIIYTNDVVSFNTNFF